MKIATFTSSLKTFEKINALLPHDSGIYIKSVSELQNCVPKPILGIIDATLENIEDTLKNIDDSIYKVLMTPENGSLKTAALQFLHDGLVDDLLTTPLRSIDVVTKIKHAVETFHAITVNDIDMLNADLQTIITKMEEDLRRARNIQKSLIPPKFVEPPGLKIVHRYLSGMKSGGDYLDVFEFSDKTRLGILMSDCSGYGLSAAFLAILWRLNMKLSRDMLAAPTTIVRQIYDELKLTMKPQDHLSVFFGILNRKTFEFIYTSCGSIRLIQQNREHHQYHEYPSAHSALQRDQEFSLQDHHFILIPADRITLMSDGFSGSFSTEDEFQSTLKKHVTEEPLALVNDCVFRVAGDLQDTDNLPTQDCSVLVIDIETNVIRLAKPLNSA